jgi:hypothetical protein
MAVVGIDVSEEHIASIFSVTRLKVFLARSQDVAICSSETSVLTITTRRDIPEGKHP